MQPTAHAERGNRCARMSTVDTVAIPLVIGDPGRRSGSAAVTLRDHLGSAYGLERSIVAGATAGPALTFGMALAMSQRTPTEVARPLDPVEREPA